MTFSSVQEIYKTYFPSYEKPRQESSIEDYEQSRFDLTIKLAKEHHSNLLAKTSRRGNAKRQSSSLGKDSRLSLQRLVIASGGRLPSAKQSLI
jgi:hypothetical protein